MTSTPASPGAGVRISGIVLAAGASRRMGRPKAFLDHRGRTFLESVIAMLEAGGCADVTVVFGHDAAVMRARANLDQRPHRHVVINPDWELGQFSSLQAALRARLSAPQNPPGQPPADAILVALVDQPHVPPSVPRALIAHFALHHSLITRPTFATRGGHPLLLAPALLPEILSHPPTATLADILRPHIPDRHDVPVDAPEILTDFDTPEDLGG